MITTDSGSLYERTLELVRTAPRRVSYSDMASACDTSVSWVSRFAAGKIKEPSVNTVERLYKYLNSVQEVA